MLTLQEVKENQQIKEFIRQTEIYLDALKYTDHGQRHLNIVADRSRKIARHFHLSAREQEIAAIAGYCHDMGNFMGRTQHHYWASFLFSQVFINEINPRDLASIMQAIASHDKHELKIVNKVTAALIIADKSDVHRTRVKEKNLKKIKADIHDRVNYSVTKNDLQINSQKKEIILKLQIDTKITKPLDYFDIFLERMTFCKEAARYLNYNFVLIINDFKLS